MCFAANSRICVFLRFSAGLNRTAKSMLQKFKVLPMAYLAAYQIASKLLTKNANENSNEISKNHPKEHPKDHSK